MKKILTIATIIMVLTLTALAAQKTFLSTPSITPGILTQIGAAFKMYAGESKGEKFPIMGTGDSTFRPDMTAFGKYIDALPDPELARAYLTDQCGVQLCYLGYAVKENAVGLAFLEHMSKMGNNHVQLGKDINFSSDNALERFGDNFNLGRSSTVYQLREGIERFLITSICDPAASNMAQSELPILWEMPDNQDVPGGWVLYMDGNVEWLPYPSKFPMTQGFIEQLRDFIPVENSQSIKEDWVTKPPPWNKRPKPTLAFLPEELKKCYPLQTLEIAFCDKKPSVKVDGYRGHRLKDIQSKELVLFPEDTKVSQNFKETIWPRFKENDEKVIAYMGTGYGFHWFAHSTVAAQEDFRHIFKLEGGDDRLELLSKAGDIARMPRFGKRAVPYLEKVITQHTDPKIRADAITALYQIPLEQKEKIIIAAVAPGNANALENLKALCCSYALDESDHAFFELVKDAYLISEGENKLASIVFDQMMNSSKRNLVNRRFCANMLKQLSPEITIPMMRQYINEAKSVDWTIKYLEKLIKEIEE